MNGPDNKDLIHHGTGVLSGHGFDKIYNDQYVRGDLCVKGKDIEKKTLSLDLKVAFKNRVFSLGNRAIVSVTRMKIR